MISPSPVILMDIPEAALYEKRRHPLYTVVGIYTGEFGRGKGLRDFRLYPSGKGQTTRWVSMDAVCRRRGRKTERRGNEGIINEYIAECDNANCAHQEFR